MAEALGVLGAAIYYVWDIVRGDTRPHRVSWGVWTIIGVLGYGTATEGGAGPGAYAAGIYLIAQVVTFGLSLVPRYGKPGGRWYDWPPGAVALAGVLTWQLAGLSIVAAAALAVAADAIATWPTVRESWFQPASESLPAWSADVAGNVLAVVVLADWSFEAAVYPVYLLAMSTLVATILITRSIPIVD
jgi:hypothetical protein